MPLPLTHTGRLLPDDALLRQLQDTLGTSHTIERELGGGGMSRVYVAVENRFQRRVVIKVLSPELSQGLSGERFEREIGLAAGLQQANIVPVISAGDVNGLPWYSMPYVDGESLRARMERGIVAPADAIAILKDVARALAYAHERGVIHRDIKPENVLLSGDAAVVTDFGIAKAVSASKTQAPGGTLTQVGTSIGTPAYMAPEQAVGSEVDQRADIYSWGVMAYELLAHAHPFAGKTTAQQLVAAHIAEVPRPLPAGTPAAKLIARTLEKDPAKRPASAKELIDVLNGVSTVERVAGEAPARRWTMIAVGLAVVVLIAVSAVMVARRTTTDSASPQSGAISTIAVLPFVNTGGDPKDEYFSDGMTDELAHALSQLPGLRLAGRMSSFSFKGRSADARDVGKALDVAGIVEGTVRRSGDRLRVTASLTSTTDGKQRWSNSYESTAKDVFTVQDELTRAIVAALAPALRGQQPTNVAQQSRGTNNAEAYDFYLKGRHFWQERGAQNLLRSVDNYRQAIARDSAFARAYAGLSMVYVVMPSYVGDPADTLTPMGIAAARKALALDSTTLDARLALAFAELHEGSPEKSLLLLAGVVKDAPDNATAHQWYANSLTAAGRTDEAVAEYARAAAIDPLSAVIPSNLAYSLAAAGRLPEAVRAIQRTIQLDPHFWDAPAMSIYILNGQADSALVHLGEIQRGDSSEVTLRGMTALAYAAKGRWAQVDSIRKLASAPLDVGLIALADGNPAPLGRFMRTLSGRNEWFQAFVSLRCSPLLAPLRSDASLASVVGSNCPVIPWPIKPRPR